MAKILFNKNIDLNGFNIGYTDSNISYPNNPDNIGDIEDCTENSLLFSFVNNMYRNFHLYAQYKSQALSGDRFIIYKQGINDPVKKYIATIDNVTNGFTDYNVGNNEKYRYTVETNPLDKQNQSTQEMSISLETAGFINPHWNYWSVCDIEKNISASESSNIDVYVPGDSIFIIKNNINIGSINDNLNIIKYNTLGKYGYVMQTSQKYDSGNISCLIGDFTSVQNIFGGKNIISNINIVTQQDFDDFVNDDDNYKDYIDFYFYFPKYSDKYYELCENISYTSLSQSEIDNWSTSYDMYYEKITHQDGHFEYIHVPDYIYNKIENKPEDWDTAYIKYYRLIDGQYIRLQEKTEWNTEEEYYEQVRPEYNSDKHYKMIVKLHLKPVEYKYQFTNTIETIQLWRDCVSNGKLKLLKAPNGQKWVIKINEQNNLDVFWGSPQYPTTISFNWQEVLDINKISIIKW